jgi:hypothetical protein
MLLLRDMGHVKTCFDAIGKILILTQERCTVCAKIVLLGDIGQVEVVSIRLEIVLVLVQDRCSVCNERTIG